MEFQKALEWTISQDVVKVSAIKEGDEEPNPVLEMLKELKSEIAGIKAEKANQSNAEKLTSKLKELGVKENFYKGRLKTDFENDDQIAEYAQEQKSDEDAFLQSLNIETLKNTNPPIFGTTKVSDDEVSPEVQALIKSKQQSNE